MRVVSRRSWRSKESSGNQRFCILKTVDDSSAVFRLRPYRYRMIARMCIPCGAVRYVLEYGL